MIKKFIQILGLSFAIIFISITSAFASGKMEVSLNDTVTFATEDPLNGDTLKWVVQKEERILATRSDRQLSYTFGESGEYVIKLSVTDPNGSIRNTRVMVLAGETYARRNALSGADFSPGGQAYGPGGIQGAGSGAALPSLFIALETLPARSPDQRVHLMGSGGKVIFSLRKSFGDIIEYRVDSNIYVDSDGNGVASDDIDNAGSPSYLTGASWEAPYTNAGVKQVVAEITLVDKQGKKAKEQVGIVFDPLKVSLGPVVARLEVSPAADTDTGITYLYGDKADVSFYARPSTGKILEYRIDKDIFADSNGDGNPANDIDNLNDSSFKTGDIWKTAYTKTDRQIIAQLIVVGEGGKGSRVQRSLAFTDKPLMVASPQPSEKDLIHIEANKEFVLKGDPIEFQVVGLQQALKNYTFGWDLNGDGTTDKEVEGDNTMQHIYAETGTFQVTVRIKDKDGNSADRKISILVKKEIKTEANFSHRFEAGKTFFENHSVAAGNLADKTLNYTWNFGDTDEKNAAAQQGQTPLENPTYSYAQPGTYHVTLTVSDIDGVISETTQDVMIDTAVMAESSKTAETPENGKTPVAETPSPATVKASESFFGSALASIKSFFKSPILIQILKILLYVILAIVVLILILLIGLIVLIKVQHPSLHFDELIEEMKLKILTIIGIKDYELEAVARSNPPEPEVVEGEVAETEPSTEEAPAEPDTPDADEPDEETQPEEEPKKDQPPLADTQGPIPDWLKNA